MAPFKLADANGTVGAIFATSPPHIIAWVFAPEFRTGSFVLGAIGVLSTVSVYGLGLYLLLTAFAPHLRAEPSSRNVRAFFSTDFGFYLGSLLTLHFLSSVGSVVNLVWATAGVVWEGRLCDFQGSTKLASAIGPPIWNLALAAQSFHTFVWSGTTPPWFKYVVSGVLWFALMVPNVVGTVSNRVTATPFSFYGPQPKGCTNRLESPGAVQFVTQFTVAILVLLLVTLFLYICTALKLLGVFGLRARPTGEYADAASDAMSALNRRARNTALKMLAFPLLSIAIAAPNLILSLLNIFKVGGRNKNAVGISTASAGVLASAGFFEVLLFLWTRRALLSNAGSAHSGASTNRARDPKIRHWSIHEVQQDPPRTDFVELDSMRFAEGSDPGHAEGQKG